MTHRRVAYVLAGYPARSETFIRREIEAVRGHGVQVDIYALRKGEGSTEVGEATYRKEIPVAEKCMSLLWAALRPLKLARAIGGIFRDHFAEPSRFCSSLRNLAAAAAFARRIKRSGAGCVHAHFANEPTAVARSVSLLVTIPYTFSVHAYDIFVDNPTLTDKIGSARAVAACTEAAARRVRELTPSDLHHKIHVVRHGVGPLPSSEQTESERRPLVLMVGRLVEKKGVPTLLAAVKLLRDKGRPIECVILGDGTQRASVERAVDELGIKDAVQLPGWAAPEDVRKWMSRASVLAAPSVVTADGDRDGLPNVILEAAAAGLPVVASDVGGIGEFVCNEVTGLLVTPGDADALATAIERMMEDEVFRKKVAEAAREKVGREYDAYVNAGALIKAMGWKS